MQIAAPLDPTIRHILMEIIIRKILKITARNKKIIYNCLPFLRKINQSREIYSLR